MKNVHYKCFLVLVGMIAYSSAMDFNPRMRVEPKHSKDPRHGVPSEVHITAYLLADTKFNNTVLATATFAAYSNVPCEKTADILKSHFFTHSDFKNLFTSDSNIIIFQNLTVTEEYRFKGCGKTLVSKVFGYLGSNYSNYTMIWHANPTGEKTLDLESLCVFYTKQGGTLLGNDKHCARFYKKF